MKAKKIIFTALAVLFQIALSSLAFANPYGEKSRPDSADLHPKKVTHKKSTGAKKVTFLEEKNGKRKCTSRSKNQSNN